MNTERAILAGGCFWGVEELIRHYPGVISTIVGYTGGDVPNATYQAEAIEIVFDPSKLSYRGYLNIFSRFMIQQPVTDRGTMSVLLIVLPSSLWMKHSLKLRKP